MPYKLLLSEEISPAIRRMGLEQLTRVRRELSSTQDIQTGVHKSRTCIKRFRSLLRLARPLLGEDVFSKENKKSRDIARALSQPREAGALLETIEKLKAREDFEAFKPLMLELKSIIAKQKNAHEADLEILSLTKLLEKTDKSIERWNSLELETATFKKLAHGFAQTYDRGRDSLMKAIKRDDNFYLHEWRKDVQQTWRQMQILTLIWPDDIMPRIKLARDVSRLLGTENDLFELERFMKLNKKRLKKNPELKALYQPFRSTLRHIRRDLSLHALERGRRLYAFEAEAIADALNVYWQTSRALQPLPSIALELTEIEKAAASKQSSTPTTAEKDTKPKLSALERMRAAKAAQKEGLPPLKEIIPKPSDDHSPQKKEG